MKQKQRFSLIKLRVGVFLFLLVGIFIGFNYFSFGQRLKISRKKLVRSLELARNYALAGQNSGGGELGYVEVTIDESGVMEAWPNGGGSSYYSADVSRKGIAITVEDDKEILFRAKDGRMLKDSEGLMVPLPTGETVKIVLSGVKGEEETQVVEMGALGLVKEE